MKNFLRSSYLYHIWQVKNQVLKIIKLLQNWFQPIVLYPGYTTPPLYYRVSLLISKEAQAKFNMDSCHSILTGPIRRGAVFLLLCSNNNIQSLGLQKHKFSPNLETTEKSGKVSLVLSCQLCPHVILTLCGYRVRPNKGNINVDGIFKLFPACF